MIHQAEGGEGESEVLRMLAGIVLIASLTACESSGDFILAIDQPSETVEAELAAIDPNQLTRSAGVEPVEVRRADSGSVFYTLPNPHGESGKVLFDLGPTGPDRARIAVTVRMPKVSRTTAQGVRQLGGEDMERMLRDSMRDWNLKLSQGEETTAEREEIAAILSLYAVGLQDIGQFDRLALETGLSAVEQIAVASEQPARGLGWGEADMPADPDLVAAADPGEAGWGEATSRDR